MANRDDVIMASQPRTAAADAPLLQQSSHSTTRSSTSAGRRRRSKLTSFGRWDWSYETQNPRFAKLPDDQAFGIKFTIFKKSRFLHQRLERVVGVSVPERTICISSKSKAICFPTASVSRLTPQGDRFLEIRAARQVGTTLSNSGKTNSWIKTVEFAAASARDEFLNLVRGLNSVGGTVSSMYARVGHLITADKLVRCLLSIESEPGYEPPSPKQPITETTFFQWFLLVSQDREPNTLVKRLEEALIDTSSGASGPEEGPGGPGSRKTSAATNSEKRPQASSISKRGPLFVEPRLVNRESVIIIEDTVTLVAKLDSREVRHIVGELILTNLRLYFCVYESELTARAGMTAMNGPQGLVKYAGVGSSVPDSEQDLVNGSERSLERERSGGGLSQLMHPSSSSSGLPSTDGFFVREVRASVASLRFGRRPDTVYVTANIPLASLSKVECKHSNLVVETTLGRQLVFQFDRGDSYVATFVDRVSEARKTPFYSFSLGDALALPPIYDPKHEFERQCANAMHFCAFENTGYDLCSTYPSTLFVPTPFAKKTSKLDAVARFRSRARVPAITWVHPGETNLVIARSSQPLTGFKQARCAEDEELLALIRGNKRMFVVDARGPAAVAGNQLVRGKGTEIPSNYPEVTFLFMGIANIHSMRNSQERLAAACSPGSFDSDKFLQRVEDSKWLSFVRLILDAATRCAELIELEKASVLVHCSDGWDRTAQLVSLAQMVLDPFYRTLRGFACLVEKDWVAFGFKFRDRCTGPDEDEKSPVWIQFLDCVFQFRKQFPRHFEFNEDFLLVLAEAPYTHRFATFAFNSECERTEACRHNKPRAWEFWGEVLSRGNDFRNPTFEPFDGPLWPNTSAKRVILWEGLHLRGDAGAPPSVC